MLRILSILMLSKFVIASEHDEVENDSEEKGWSTQSEGEYYDEELNITLENNEQEESQKFQYELNNLQKNLQEYPLPALTDNNSKHAKAPQKLIVQKMWNCDTCTFLNKEYENNCEICEAKRFTKTPIENNCIIWNDGVEEFITYFYESDSNLDPICNRCSIISTERCSECVFKQAVILLKHLVHQNEKERSYEEVTELLRKTTNMEIIEPFYYRHLLELGAGIGERGLESLMELLFDYNSGKASEIMEGCLKHDLQLYLKEGPMACINARDENHIVYVYLMIKALELRTMVLDDPFAKRVCKKLGMEQGQVCCLVAKYKKPKCMLELYEKIFDQKDHPTEILRNIQNEKVSKLAAAYKENMLPQVHEKHAAPGHKKHCTKFTEKQEEFARLLGKFLKINVLWDFQISV